MNKYKAYTEAANDSHFTQESESMNPGPTSKYPIDPMWEVTSKYYIDRLWEEYHKVKNDLAAVRIDASSAWQEYHKMKEELADTKSRLGQMDDYVNEVLKPELADAKIKLKMAQSAWDELDKSHAARAKLHDELMIAEGQRDQAVRELEIERMRVTPYVGRAMTTDAKEGGAWT
jgi:chromosome segregation ATPase